ncbi:uncharacterized protein LOC111078170 [Drosophila obscura]|uniref:uncharacterized protein LOC111078170 n=1 Tax=Drosophila obscura TaxID=7282 RepID=UPI001BB2B643|nr:uncharacterized protein LOC111078170 [Drosophila obscura]
MSFKKRLGARRQATAAVPLNDYFSSNEEPNTSTPAASLGTIPSNGFSHTSNVTPILTPTPQDNDKQSKSESVPATPPATVWDSGTGTPNKVEQAAPRVQAETEPSMHQSVAKWLISVPTQIQTTSQQQPELELEASVQGEASHHEPMNPNTSQQVDPPTNLDIDAFPPSASEPQNTIHNRNHRRRFWNLPHKAEANAQSQLSGMTEETPATGTHNSGKAPQALAHATLESEGQTLYMSTNFQSRRRPRRQRRTFTAKDLIHLNTDQDGMLIMGNEPLQPQALPYNYYCSAPALAPAPAPALSPYTATAAVPNPIILSAIPASAPVALAPDLSILPIEVLLMPKRIDFQENISSDVVVYQPQTGEILARADVPLQAQPQPAAMENCNPMVSQSVFRLASLPSTGVGTDTDITQNAVTTTQWDGCSLPSSISAPSQASPSPSSWCQIEAIPSYLFATQEKEVAPLCPNMEQETLHYSISSLYQNQEPNITSFSDLLKQDLMDNSQSMDSLKLDQNTNNAQSTLSSATREEEWGKGWNLSQGDLARDLMYSRPLLNMDLEDISPKEQQSRKKAIHAIHNSLRNEDEIKIDQVDPDTHGTGHSSPKSSTVARHQLFGRRPANETHPKPDLNFVPSSVKKLYQLICSQYSDYAFIYALSAQLSQECVPMDCYVYLKMVLLASIVSIEPDELRSPISLCIIATDGAMADLLMSSVGQLAPRFIGPHEGGLQASHSALPVRYTWVLASPLLMAQQGVYYAGDWTRLSREHSEQLEKSIENGAVPVPQIQGEQPLEAAIWTHWQPENATNQTVAFAKLCPIFGLPIYMGEQVSDSLWSFLLQQHSEDGQKSEQDGLNVPEEDLRILLGLLHQRKVTFGDAAQCLLQKYYVISRKERPTVFSSKTYIVLKQFAESFAKLAMRLEVLEADVIVAIFHCEHFVQTIFGAKELPAPSVETFSVISHIDPYMDEFTRWLFNYLDQYSEEELGIQVKRRRTDSWGDME